ncbi:hypothetical protein ECDEC5C_5230 [Escherichia coli DEC5C]|nr:hypothetical protein ECDEC5C_5230 [Escherichia coli DEC5C]
MKSDINCTTISDNDELDIQSIFIGSISNQHQSDTTKFFDI